MKALILAGGAGTRLWPASRETYPKQFFERRKLLLELRDVCLYCRNNG